MADNFGLKIGLEGEKEFKKALADINSSFKVLGSEMKLVASQFDKNDKSVDALTSRNTVLNKEIEAQKQKIEVLRSALENAAESFGENDRRTQAWQIQLNNAEAALNDMERELADNNAALDEANAGYGRAEDALDGMDREMDNVTDSADDMGDEIDEAGDAAKDSESKFESLGNVLKTVGAAMGAVLVAAGAAAVKLGKEVVSAFADYEQLVGGIDTLFKDSSGKLQEYAEGAYKTAGLSANEYMETVTSFSASLISSLGGDTEKAVEYADMAIRDKCTTPALTDEEIKTRFISAFNSILESKGPYIETCRMVRDLLTDTTDIDNEMSDLLREMEIVAELTRKCIAENSSMALDQTEYMERYNGYVARYDKAKSRYDILDAERKKKQEKAKAIDRFIRTVESRDGLLSEFDPHLWLTTVERVTVMADGKMRFRFFDGSETTN